MLLDNWQIQAGDNWLQVPELCEDLLSSVDQPLKIARDKTVSIKSHKYWFHLISSKVGKDYLLCDYNRDGDSYRCVMYNCFCCAGHNFQRLLDKMLTSTTYSALFLLTWDILQVALEQPVWASLGWWSDAKREIEEAGDWRQHCIRPVQRNVFRGRRLLCLPLGSWPWFCR